MQITSIIAIYSLFWVISAFVVLPFGIQTPDQSGEKVFPRHSDSAPPNFLPCTVLLISTLLAPILFVVFYFHYLDVWLSTFSLNVFGLPPPFSIPPSSPCPIPFKHNSYPVY